MKRDLSTKAMTRCRGIFSDICNVNLFTYLDLLLDQSIESVRTLKGAGLKPTEIAEKMHLHPEQIMNLI